MQPKQIAKQIRNNLLEQKKRLETYLLVLDKEDEDLINGDADKLIEHIELEKNILSELMSFKKILTPLEIMYNSIPYKKESNLEEIKKSIGFLSSKVEEKSKLNKKKLETILVKVKTDLKGVSKKKMTNSVYSSIDSVMVDVCG